MEELLPFNESFQFLYNTLAPVTNLQGRKLKVVGLADPDYTWQLTLKSLPTGEIEFNSGFTYEILQLLEYALNFTHVAIKGSGWSDLLPNGTWVGIGGQLINDKLDLSIAQSTILDFNVKAFDFLIPTVKGYLVASFRQPPSNSVRNIATASFSNSLWILIFAFAILFIISVKVFEYARSFSRRKENDDDKEEEGMDISLADDAAYWILVTFCADGSPESIPMRIIYLALTVLCILTYVSWSASLVSILSVELVPIRTFTDLIQSQMKVFGDASTPFTHGYILNVVNEQQKELGNSPKTALDDSHFVRVQAGVKLIVERKGTYITFDDALNKGYSNIPLGDNYICGNIYKLTVPGIRMNGAMSVRKGSGLREIFNPRIAMLIERGFLKRTVQHLYFSQFPKCVRDNANVGTPLNITDVITGFVILFTGLCLCSIALFVERLCFYYLLSASEKDDDKENSGICCKIKASVKAFGKK